MRLSIAAIYLLPLSISPQVVRHYSPETRRTRQARGVTIRAGLAEFDGIPVTAYPHFSTAMALLPILEFPDPRLRTKAAPVDPAQIADPAFQRLLDDMFETMYEAPGIGLAASQVDVHKRFMVIDVSEDEDRAAGVHQPGNPREDRRAGLPGRLPVGARHLRRRRPAPTASTCVALDRHGQPLELQVDGLLAVCIQHEMDHLDGKLFVDYLSPLKREMVRKKLAKQRKRRATRRKPRE